MKKHVIAALLAILACLAVLAGCAGLKAFERDVQVVLNVRGEYYGCYTVNIFNNAVVPVPEAEKGETFLGWTPQENWAELETDEIVVSANKGLIRYDDVKDYVKGEAASITLYAAFAVIPPKDLVVAWYRAEGVSTATGLNQEIMNTFTENMYAYLETKDYHPEEMDIVVRPYDKNVGTSCAAILADGDVDIMVGWAGNINSQGGIVFKENVSGIEIGTISRYAARLTDTYLARLVFVWIQNTYGGANLPEPDPNEEPTPEPEPEPEPEPSELPTYTVPADEQFSIKIAWYAKSATSGIDALVMASIETALKEDLEKMGFNLANVTITTKGYDGNVGPSCEAVMADGDVDIMLGWGSNIGTTGGMTKGEHFLENVGGVKFGDVMGRYVTLVTDSDFAKIVFAWLQNTYGTAVDYPACFGWEPPATEPEPEPEPEPTDQVKIVIAWYSKSATSGISEDDMNALKSALTTYLVSKNYEEAKLNIVIRAYDGTVGETCAAIKAAGDVDIMIGWSSTENLTGTGGFVEGTDFLENVGEITVGSKARYAARLTDTELVNLVFDWIEATYGPSTEPEPEPEPEPTEKTKLVIGWYALEKTSGLNAEIMANFEKELKAFLETSGYKLDEIELVIRAYDQSAVADMGAAINADGDVDVLLGVGANITSKGGVEVVEKVGSIPMGGIDRYVALRVESELGRLVYNWVITEEGYASLATPSTEPEPTEKVKLVIGWYALEKTSGLNAEIMANFEVALKAFLETSGYKLDEVELVIRAYDQSKVADMGTAINADGDVDVLLGVGANITTGGGVEVVEKEGNIPMGGINRYVALRVESELGRLVYEWVKTEAGYASLAPIA